MSNNQQSITPDIPGIVQLPFPNVDQFGPFLLLIVVA
jgi:hypothetical protein